MLGAVARRTGNAVIVTNRAGLIEWVNEGFTRLTGFTADEAIGGRPGKLLQGPETSPTVRATMAQAVAAGEPFDVVVLNYTRSGTQYWVRIEAEPMRDSSGSVTGYLALETDVTEQRIAEGREQLTKKVGDLLLTCDSSELAAQMIVQQLVRTLDVRTSSIWIVDAGQPHLRYVAGACADADGQEWLDVTARSTFRRGTEWVVGVGAPGVAWGTGALCMRTDFWDQDHNGQFSRRANAARRARIRTVCAIPVHGPAGTVAVVEIGGSHNYPGHDRLPSLVERIAQQFGAFILQHESRRAFELLFRQSPDAMLVVNEGGIVHTGNARAIAMFGEVRGVPLRTLLDDADALLSKSSADVDTADGMEARARPIQRQAHTVEGAAFSAELTVSSTTATGAPSYIVSVRDMTERLRAEVELRRLLEEKMTLVEEVHHRVKNNLQVISSLVSLQADDIEDEATRSVLLNTANRIQSMALVHQQLYASDSLAHVVFGDYANAVCQALRSSMAPSAGFTFEADVVKIPLERAVPAGLILNELLTNAFKYGRDPDGRCLVRIEVKKRPRGFSFSVCDEGPGMAGRPERKGSIGQRLIGALLRQLRATRTIESPVHDGIGTCVRIDVDHPTL